nr:YHS domain-containing protein [uncultured Cellulosilyticum sp.]
MTFILDFIMQVILIIGAISFFNLIIALFKVRKVMKMQKDNPNIQGISIVNGEVKIIEKGQMPEEVTAEPIKDLVVDPVCHKEIKKSDAYRVIKDGEEYFFCSWDCREAFLKGEHEQKGEV